VRVKYSVQLVDVLCVFARVADWLTTIASVAVVIVAVVHRVIVIAPGAVTGTVVNVVITLAPSGSVDRLDRLGTIDRLRRSPEFRTATEIWSIADIGTAATKVWATTSSRGATAVVAAARRTAAVVATTVASAVVTIVATTIVAVTSAIVPSVSIASAVVSLTITTAVASPPLSVASLHGGLDHLDITRQVVL